MIHKSALTNLTLEEAEFAFAQAKTKPGAVVEMLEQSNGRWTVTVVWDDTGAAVEPEHMGGFERTAGPLASQAEAQLGVLSAKFESNGNPAAIGHDSTGGFSYGAYQIATRTGTMDDFLEFLERRFPPLFIVLDGAGGSTAAAQGTQAFKDAWRALAANPDFMAAQHAFIEETHYAPFVERIRNGLALDAEARSDALKNVVWSVGVQHGARNSVFANALSSGTAATMTDAAIIEAVYRERSNLNRYFPSSTPQVREALLARFEEEKTLALQMLS